MRLKMSIWRETEPGQPMISKMCEALRDAAPTQVPAIVYCGGQGGDQGTRALVNNLYSSSIVGEDGKWNIDENGVKALAFIEEDV